jgi:hypothetical protein
MTPHSFSSKKLAPAPRSRHVAFRFVKALELQAPASGHAARGLPRTLSDLRSLVLRIACDRRGRSGRYSVARLWRERGDVKLTDFLAELTADCRRKGPAIYDRLAARFEF